MTSEEFSKRIVALMQTLYRVSFSYLAASCDRDDAVQECLCKAWAKRHQLRDESVMQTWVIRILINECRNIHRKRKREISQEEMPQRAAPPDADTGLHDALFSLDETLRLPIVLHYIEGYSTKEVAWMMKIPHGTVKSRLSRARNELKKILEGEAR